MARKKVLILGASRYYSRCIESAKRAGYFTIVADRNPNSDGFRYADQAHVCDITNVEGILEIASTSGIAGIVPVNDYGVPTAAKVAATLKLPGISPKTAELATNKELMRARWISAGIPCPQVIVATTPHEIEAAAGKIGYPCILKPAHGIGGASRGVIVVEAAKDLKSAIKFTHSFYEDKTTLVETFVVAEREHSAEVLVCDGQPTVIAISDKVKTPLPYRVDKCVLYPTSIPASRLAALEDVICRSVISIGINNGAAHVELASTKTGYVLFELGARCGGGGTPEPIVPKVTGVSLFVELVRILCGDRPINIQPKSLSACSYHFLVLPPGKIAAIDGFDQIVKQEDVLDAELFIAPGQDVSEVQTGIQRSGFMIVTAATAEQAYERGVELEGQIKISYVAN